MRHKPLIAVAAAVAAVPVGVASAATTELRATMRGSSEVPRANTRATGTAEFEIAANGRSIHYELRARRLSGRAQAAHVHLGRPGRAGGVLLSIALRPFSLPREGTLTARQFSAVGNVRTFAQAVRAMRAGRTYVNIHTARFPAGEIRGQLRTYSE